ncbi:Transcription factor [Penicillium concentricum]|uniref:Transcription factor n=1 Tax=Penicillium concentricum TaxID=293559 RepID=A0A9W9RUZ6_9EURO|nr:Transcription factor [Penicillium concentricum]KAJ5365524.1 Transcription factor [Penicillium concentricum]
MLRRTRRSPTACSWCRHRKVRCDAAIFGSPCTRCRQDGRSECVLRAQNPNPSPKSGNPVLPTQRSLASNNVITGRHPDHRRQSNGHQPLTSQLRAQRLSPDDRSTSPPNCPNVPYTEYAFVDSQQLLSLSSEDIAFLTSKNCLNLPASDTIDAFVQQYFRRIHPLVPVLDEAEFWRIYRNNQSTGSKISLFVLQSLLCASCPLLFDLKTEKRSHANAQGAVMLTHYTSADDPQSGSLWVTRAIEHAMLNDDQPFLAENVAISLKKRLWWSILLRDRSLSVGLRRRPQVTSVSLHGWSDWLSTEDFSEELHQSQVYDYDTKKRLLEALQKQCELAVLLTDLVTLAFTHQKTPRRLLSMIEFQGLLLSIKNIKKSLDEWELPIQPLSSPSETSTSEGNDAVEKLTHMTYMYYQFWLSVSSAAQVDLAQYAAYILEENVFYAGDRYSDLVLEISNDLRDGIEGLSLVMEHFSINGYADSLPLSVLVPLSFSSFTYFQRFATRWTAANMNGRLGYVSMPLVLAAIDLKLSPSQKETEARQRRLNSLSQIIRHSETLYDVTDRVAVATNHLLQLAYVTTQNLPLEQKAPQLYSSDKIARENALPSNQSPARASNKSISPRTNRPTSWQDAFIRCPRAYLLISTAVDYTMAIGNLPCANVLPEIVRDLPAMGVIARLPWTSEIPFSQSTNSLVSRMSQIQWKSYPASVRSSSVEWIDVLEPINIETGTEKNLTPQRVQFNYNSSRDAFSEYSATPSFIIEEQLRYIDRVAEQTAYKTTAPNLDFMDFGDCQSASNNVTETCAVRIPLEFFGHDLQAESPLDQQVFDTYGATLPQSIKAIDSTIFDSFFHAGFEQNWVVQ